MAVIVDKKLVALNKSILASAYCTTLPTFKAFNLRLAAARFYNAGEVEIARNLVDEALNCYPLFHPHRIHALEQLIRYYW